MAKIHYDPKVEELARFFLEHGLVTSTGAGGQTYAKAHEGRVTRLSEQIQQTIEDFLKFDW